MFPVESLPAHYYEEREAAEAAKKLAQLHAPQAQAPAAASCSSSANATPRSGIARPAATVLGSIFQGFVTQASPSPPPSFGKDNQCTSGASTPVSTASAKVVAQVQIEAAMAEKRRDADIVGFRAW